MCAYALPTKVRMLYRRRSNTFDSLPSCLPCLLLGGMVSSGIIVALNFLLFVLLAARGGAARGYFFSPTKVQKKNDLHGFSSKINRSGKSQDFRFPSRQFFIACFLARRRLNPYDD